MFITRYALKNPVAVTLLFVTICAIGVVALARMGRSTLPPVSIPVVSIVASYSGAGPREIEQLIIEPLEDQIDGIPGVSRVSASAQNGLAELTIQFRFGTNVEVDRAGVQQAVDAARVNMPPDLAAPAVSKDDPAQAPILDEAVSSVLVSDTHLSDLLTREIAPALRATGGVGTVTISGGQTRQFTLRPKLNALNALRATSLDVFRAAAGGNDVFPGGLLRSPNVQTTIGIDAAAVSLQDLQALPVALPGGAAVRMRDVADVYDTYADPSTLSRVDGQPSAIITVSRATDADVLRTIASVQQTFRRLAAQNPQVRFEELRTDAPSTDAAIGGVLQTLGEGIVLTVLVMLLFLHAWRNAVIAAIAIPTSLCAAFTMMWALGFSLNVLSLMGLSLTIGILVDDSIVIIEAISRNVRPGRDPDGAALAGRRELGGAAFAITLVDVAVFAPVAMMPGLVGEFMREFGLAIVFASAFSLIVSYTLTPLLAARWALVKRSFSLDGLPYSAVAATLGHRARTFPWTFRSGPLFWTLVAWHGVINQFNRFESSVAEAFANRWLPWAWRSRRAIGIIAVLASLASCAPVFVGAVPMEFTPPINRGEAIVDLTLPPGTPLNQTDSAAFKISSALLNNASVAHVEATAGRAFNGTSEINASNVAELAIVMTDPSASAGGIVDAAKSLNALVPQASIAGAGKGMGGSAPVSYSVGGDPAAIDTAANRIVDVLRATPYATDIRTSDLGTAPNIRIRVDDERARLLNVNTDDVAQTARIASGGALAARARLSSGLVNVIVQSGAEARGDLAGIRNQTVRSGEGSLIPLGDVTSIQESPQPVVIERENGSRVVTVSANPAAGEPLSVVTAAVSRRLRDPNFLPAGARIEPRGDIEQFVDTVTRIGAALALSLLVVYMILAVLYRSYALPFIIMLTVPLASIGAFGTLLVLNALRTVWPSASMLQSQTLNLYSMLGIVMLVGLVAKNGILLVEYAERSFRSGSTAFDAMTRAARLRFRPILMTTVAMIAGMLPLALGHTAGAEYRRALGTVVIGGLTTSLLLTLFVLPIVYLAYRRNHTQAVSVSAVRVSH